MIKNTGFILCTALTLAMSGAASADTTWRMATKMPVDSPEGRVFERFAELTEDYTDGALTITIFPNEQLGKENAVLEQLQANIVQLYAEGYGYMKKWEPALDWTAPSFVFDDYDHWVRFMQTDLVQSWFDNAAEQAGVRMLGDPTRILRGPFLVTVSNVPINSAADYQGLKLRMHESTRAIDAWTALGAEVITLPWTEVYQSISKGIVEGLNSPIALVEAMRFNEVAPHITRIDEFWQSIGFMVNAQAYEALDDETRMGLLKAYDEAGAFSRELMFDVAQQSIARMQEQGATYSVLDTSPLIETMATYYQEQEAAGNLPVGMLDAIEATRDSTQ
ncbi:TRAP transporter substrate-binding protein [Roseicitreum antarcticum]|uniref:TRAP-type C4-dicarboxylate transport system, substrate-binding protein n=1 Tax=Roseicitreum antarcticum TaxID=564137 RepID=A0A1H2Z4U4_9RHOB|nr:TRAP transporter substrate-binding protein [Roseicitreum antarcticum]SDX12351.1 TRAP-type C4-dicarboxylate transport system, substrate-binding protein [Roseicitreum antarcticum]